MVTPTVTILLSAAEPGARLLIMILEEDRSIERVGLNVNSVVTSLW